MYIVMSVIKAKRVDLHHVSFGVPRKIIDNNYSIPLYYNNNSFIIQLPRSQLFTGIYERDGKCYCELLIPSDGVVQTFYENLAEKIQNDLCKNPKFNGSTFVGHMRTIEVQPGQSLKCIRVKLPQCKSHIITCVTKLETKEKLGILYLQKGCAVVPLVSIEYVYVVNGCIGFNLLLKEVAIS